MEIVSIDLSLRSTGMTIFNQEKNSWTYLAFLRRDVAKPKILVEIAKQGIVYFIHTQPEEMINNILTVLNNKQTIFCEGLSYNSKSSSALELAKANGALQYGVYQKGLNPITFVAPRSIKKSATGFGNSSKNDMYFRYIQYNPDSEFRNCKPFEDCIDAFFLNLYAQNSLFQ